MPPFSGADDPVVIGLNSDGFVSSTTSNDGTSRKIGEDLNEDKLVVENFSGFDRCGGFDMSSIFCSVPNPAYTVFNARACHECGHNCGAFDGYEKKFIEKKVGDGSEIVETEVYFHEWCLQIHKWRIDHAKAYEPVLKDLLKHIHSVNIIARFVRRACERHRSKALEAREGLVPVKKEEKKKGIKHILSFLSKKKKVIIPPDNEVSDDGLEEKVKESAKSSFFSKKLKAASNSNTPSSEVEEARNIPEERANESTESEAKQAEKKPYPKENTLGARLMKVVKKEKAPALGMNLGTTEKTPSRNGIKFNNFHGTRIPKSSFWNRKYEI